jgi:hypothetical protein
MSLRLLTNRSESEVVSGDNGKKRPGIDQPREMKQTIRGVWSSSGLYPRHQLHHLFRVQSNDS